MAFRGIQTTNIISTDVGLTDPLLILNKDGAIPTDVGFLGKIGGNTYAGLVKDSATDNFLLISSIELSPNTVNDVDALDASIVPGNITVGTLTATTISSTSIPTDVSDLTDTTNLLVHTSVVDWTLASAGTIHASNYTDTNTTYTAGSGITLSGGAFINASPDQTVALTGAGATTISGTYPSFTITSTDTNTDTIYANSDVDSHLNQSGPTDGYVLSWTSGDYSWVANSGGGSSYSDTDVASYLFGNLDTHILPDTNATYDIGSASYKIRDLYLSDNSLHIGENVLRTDSSKLLFNGEDVMDYANITSKPTTLAGYGITDATDTNTTYSVGDGGLTQINFTSADNTKLDGIATSATANLTDAAVITAYVAADTAQTTALQSYADTAEADAITTAAATAESKDVARMVTSNAYTDTAVSNLVNSSPATLDTLNELAAALGDDANHVTTMTTLVGTKLSLAGGTMTGNLSFGDNNQIRLGASNDLAIYHDGNNSVINEEGNGTLLIQSNGSGVNIQKGTSEIMAVFRTDSSVDLYHNNVVKLETASAGIDVTGRMYSSTGVFGASDGDRIDMSSNKLGVEIGGTRRMHIDSTGVGIGTNTPTESLTLNSSSNTRLLLQEGGASKGQLAGGGGGLYIQNLTGDTIFRNSSDADTVRIKDDGKVGIGTTSPTGILHVDGHTGSLPSIFEGNGSGDEVPVQLKVKANDGSLSTQGLYGSAGSVSTDNYITLGNSGTSGIQVDNSGNAIVTGTLTATGGIVTDERTADLILKIDASQNSSAISLDPTGDVPNEMTATHGTYAGTDAWSFNGSNWIRWHADSRFASSGDYTIMIFAYHTSNDRDVLWSSYTNAQNSIVGGSTFNWCSDPNGNYHNNPPGANYQGNWYNLNEWRFHCIRYTASNGVHEIFVDGYSSAVSTTTPNFDVVGHYGDTAIGSRNDGIEQYTGYISAAWWYDAPLTNSQISRIYEIHKIRHSIDRTFI